MNWHSRFETGHPQIDAEHQEFFLKLQHIRDALDAGAGREQTVELITILHQYILGHFAREEAHMQRVGCPSRETNTAAHRAFEHKLDGWLELLTMSGTPVTLLEDVHREASQWIEHHILNIDCQLRGCPSAPPA